MDELSTKFNNLMLSEMGLEVGAQRRLYDQDTGDALQFEGKNLYAPGHTPPFPDCQEFDPYNSHKMMYQMFSYYTAKLAEAGEIPEFSVIYNTDAPNGRGRVEIKNNSDKITSDAYQRDQCRYADLILRINGEEDPMSILKEFDIPKTKEPIKKAAPKKNTDSNKKYPSKKK